MKNILAIDTATKLLGVTIQVGIKKYNNQINEGFTHSENLLPMISDLLLKAGISISDLDLLVCTRGPGSFTGLRIGMSTLKGISLGAGIPLVTVPTLDLYAYSKSKFIGVVLPIIDARKRSFYTAIFRNGIRESDNLDINSDEISLLMENEEKILLTGIDANILYEKLNDNSKFDIDSEYERSYSEELTTLGLEYYNKYGSDALGQGPVYIRKSEAELMLQKKRSE
ncbi:MAG: tRNA (adenosine(37)-N6)-threonylcarbamoyltransferase complex dimerization subunit type 1 TsaB [Spirochaetaceae bacterium 4572_7]|nr:MAG: tRNA (adenosine(37)-N6)-threonylcarbamoyltransferase complex dimerization subunit type 1 TsaB [Spirochaetaceae bacterium 4572_7]